MQTPKTPLSHAISTMKQLPVLGSTLYDLKPSSNKILLTHKTAVATQSNNDSVVSTLNRLRFTPPFYREANPAAPTTPARPRPRYRFPQLPAPNPQAHPRLVRHHPRCRRPRGRPSPLRHRRRASYPPSHHNQLAQIALQSGFAQRVGGLHNDIRLSCCTTGSVRLVDILLKSF
jgi:hypothetical protein